MTDFARHEWLTSQMQWHADQLALDPSSKWHKSQVRHYKKTIKVNFSSITDIVSIAIRNSLPQIQKNLLANNALYRKFNEWGGRNRG